jgi:hypothetical protein
MMRCCYCDAEFKTKAQALDHDCDEKPTVFVGEARG